MVDLAMRDTSKSSFFQLPRKRIEKLDDLKQWETSPAYKSVSIFLLHLNLAMFPTSDVTMPLPPPSDGYSTEITGLRELLFHLTDLVKETPPQDGPRRFGNAAFRTWYSKARATTLAAYIQPLAAIVSSDPECTAADEVKAYFSEAFGSSQRLDYGTGHELAFAAFLTCLCQLKLLPFRSSKDKQAIVLGLLAPYLELIRLLITTYTLEPAGSHGVWGLDDHSFLPYIFGSAQLSPPPVQSMVGNGSTVLETRPSEGSASWAPSPGSITNKAIVDLWASRNLYFGAIKFINTVKTGSFAEHSPTLYDISGVQAGWAKINNGMLKMFAVEVMSKFPVVQHFKFGELLRWEPEPDSSSVTNHRSIFSANGSVESAMINHQG